jgi:hypothetical protein
MYSKILLDNPSARPGLKFENYSSALRDIIKLSNPQFSIGIFGGWGSGKTTLMRAIEKKLKAENDEIIPVWFNAWRYEKEEHLIIPLLDTLRDELIAWATPEDGRAIDPTVRDRAIKAAATITKAAKAIFAGLAIKAKFPLIEVDLDANKTLAEWRDGPPAADRQDAESPQSAYHASFKALKESLTNFTDHGKQRIVVFIDDLDRCLPGNALQVLESMKLFFDLDGFIFVVGLDQKVIEASINWNYRLPESSGTLPAGLPISGAEYIKKLFQVPFNLPSVSSVQLDDYLEAVLSGNEERDAEQAELLGRVRPHLDALIGDSEVNPREIKRYVNAFILHRLIQKNSGDGKSDDSKADDDDVTLLLQTITFRPDWSAAYEVFRSRPEAFTEAARRQLVDGEDSALKDLDPRLAQLPEAFFQYINSKGGHRLVSLDPPQLAEQISTFEVTRTPEEPLHGLLRALSSIRVELDKIDPLDLSGSTAAAETFRRAIREISDDLVNEYGGLRVADPREEETMEKLLEVMRSIKDDSDRLVFALRRGDDMSAEEFDEALNRRTSLAARTSEAVQRLEEFIFMRRQ